MAVNFYILDTASKQQAMLFACKLVEKAHQQQQQVFIRTASTTESEKLDKLLWTFREDSFLPHEQDHENARADIRISHAAPLQANADVLVNLGEDIPAYHTTFTNVIELVFNEPKAQAQARERYRQYRDAGIELNTHKLKA